ncbi:phosphatidylcholine:ceramide cholinephosphotransferase 2-like isoform X2 [Symsagittifera roscoffensis]
MECSPKATGTTEIIRRILLLWSTAGLSIFGGHMCGNYFFSGHALMATIIHRHLRHYMPDNWWLLHKLNTLVALSIATMILFAHNHYTLDLIGSFIVGDWVFQLYMFLAENKDVNSAEWFPVFWRPAVEFIEWEKERVEYAFGGLRELYQFTRFASVVFFNR